MKVGVVGTGTMGRNHVRVYSELKAVEEVSVFKGVKIEDDVLVGPAGNFHE